MAWSRSSAPPLPADAARRVAPDVDAPAAGLPGRPRQRPCSDLQPRAAPDRRRRVRLTPSPIRHKESCHALPPRHPRAWAPASLGALRAAELDRFGMEGVGEIYAHYRDGRLTSDAEVALMHLSPRPRATGRCRGRWSTSARPWRRWPPATRSARATRRPLLAEAAARPALHRAHPARAGARPEPATGGERRAGGGARRDWSSASTRSTSRPATPRPGSTCCVGWTTYPRRPATIHATSAAAGSTRSSTAT